MPFDAARYCASLATRWLGREFQHFASLDSTNAHAKRLARLGMAPEGGLVILADAQTGGYGQRGRTWDSEEGAGLTFTVLTPFAPTPLLTLAVGVAATEALRQLTGSEELQLKWVNDLVLRRKKLGGILVEACHARWMAIGVGINLKAVPTVDRIGLDVLGGAVTRERVLAEVLNRLELWLERLARGEGEAVRSKWEGYAVTLGQEVRVEGPRQLVGRAEGIDESGALLLRTAEGALETVSAGTLRRLDGAYC